LDCLVALSGGSLPSVNAARLFLALSAVSQGRNSVNSVSASLVTGQRFQGQDGTVVSGSELDRGFRVRTGQWLQGQNLRTGHRDSGSRFRTERLKLADKGHKCERPESNRGDGAGAEDRDRTPRWAPFSP